MAILTLKKLATLSEGGSKRLANPVQDGAKKQKLEGRAEEVKGFKYNKTGVGLLSKES